MTGAPLPPGADAIVMVGFESGGHTSLARIPTFVLLPQIVDAVKIPVIAGGGIADGRGLCAALALGAEAAYIGTAFAVTDECLAHPGYKQAIIALNHSLCVIPGMPVPRA